MGLFLLNFCRERNNHSTDKTCLPSLIPQKSRSSAFVQSEERSQPHPLWPQRSVHWVCLPKKLVTTSQRPPKNGKVSLSCNFCGSDLTSLIHQLILKFIYRIEGHC